MDKKILDSLDERTKDLLARFLIQITINHMDKLETCVGSTRIPKIEGDKYFDTPMGELLVMVFLASEGRLDNSTKQKVLNGIETIFRNVFSNAISSKYLIPDDFWLSEIGKMIKKAKEWASS